MTRRAFATAAALALSVLQPACLPGAAQAETAATAADTSFIDQAARGGAAEVHAGQMAETSANRADVRSLARTMVRDHTWINEKLALAAKAMGVSAPTTPDAQQQQMIGQLQGLHGASFDHQYLDQQATAHQAAVALFRTEAEHGTDPTLKALANLVLPRLEAHLSMVEKLGGRPATT